MTPDENVLVAASRSDHPHHTVAIRWLEILSMLVRWARGSRCCRWWRRAFYAW
ncbi:MAG: hypothetical protein ACODUE_13850 [Synechococcus sp.]